MSDSDHQSSSGEPSLLSHIWSFIVRFCGLNEIFGWEVTSQSNDEFQLRILQTLLIVLVFNIVIASIAWKVYGPRIIDRFMKPIPSTLLEDLKQGAKELKLPQEHSPRI